MKNEDGFADQKKGKFYVRISSKWSFDTLDHLVKVLKGLYPDSKDPLEKALNDFKGKNKSSGDGSFYLFPFIANRGVYKPLKEWLEEQIDYARNIGTGFENVLLTTAFFSIVTECFEMSTQNFEKIMRFELLLRKRCRDPAQVYYCFVHPEIAKYHIFLVTGTEYREDALSILDLFKNNICSVINNGQVENPKKIISKLLFQDKDNSSRFTIFTHFAACHSQTMKQDLIKFVENNMFKFPSVDVNIQISRIHGFGVFPDFQQRLNYAKRAQDYCEKKDYFKAHNNLAQSYSDLACTRILDQNFDAYRENKRLAEEILDELTQYQTTIEYQKRNIENRMKTNLRGVLTKISEKTPLRVMF